MYMDITFIITLNYLIGSSPISKQKEGSIKEATEKVLLGRN